MMQSPLPRREFLAAAAAGVTAGSLSVMAQSKPAEQPDAPLPAKGNFPLRVVASANGQEATKLAYELIASGKDPLDAVVEGVALVEADPNDTSVGYGGLPNEEGIVQLDAAVMHGPTHLAGSVAALEKIKHPAQVARQVLRLTDHVLLVGRDALEFAKAMGFPEENLLTEKARKIWLHWKLTLSDKDDWLAPPGKDVDPDVASFFQAHMRSVAGKPRFLRPTGTIHCSGLNAAGDISCTTTTSGLAFKIPGRVGDSPIIGAGLYVDNEVGSCGSTGRGEANLQNLSSYFGVQLMKQGLAPQEAGLEVLRQVARHTHRADLVTADGRPNFDLKFYLLHKSGRYASVSMYGPDKFAVTDKDGTRLEECAFLYAKS